MLQRAKSSLSTLQLEVFRIVTRESRERVEEMQREIDTCEMSFSLIEWVFLLGVPLLNYLFAPVATLQLNKPPLGKVSPPCAMHRLQGHPKARAIQILLSHDTKGCFLQIKSLWKLSVFS